MKNPSVSLPEFPLAAARLRDYWALSKPRVTLLVWATTLAGVVLAANIASISVSIPLLFNALIGSWLVIASANVLNQVLEVAPDSRMNRTRNRPIPAGRVGQTEGLALGVVWGVLGLAQLALFVNLLTAALGALSIALYVFAYTPLKPRTHFATAIGAIPGAIPPLAGWTAVTGSIEVTGVILFAIQFLWQFPHFWAIAWLVREDYAAAGFKMLPFPEADGRATAMACLQYAAATSPFAMALALGLARPWIYALPAVALSVWFVVCANRFRNAPDEARARKLLKATILYLPLLLLAAIAAS
ncbi:MAG: heme o synthase [Armatimonadota bacterium]|nr:heme o synthase [Armatimonadota bacterium]